MTTKGEFRQLIEEAETTSVLVEYYDNSDPGKGWRFLRDHDEYNENWQYRLHGTNDEPGKLRLTNVGEVANAIAEGKEVFVDWDTGPSTVLNMDNSIEDIRETLGDETAKVFCAPEKIQMVRIRVKHGSGSLGPVSTWCTESHVNEELPKGDYLVLEKGFLTVTHPYGQVLTLKE